MIRKTMARLETDPSTILLLLLPSPSALPWEPTFHCGKQASKVPALSLAPLVMPMGPTRLERANQPTSPHSRM